MCLMTIMMVCSMSAYALDKVGNVYQIGTAEDLEEFAVLVNDGEVYACNVEQTLFYEETPFRPDFLLSDFIQVVHPGIKGLPALRYYKKTE